LDRRMQATSDEALIGRIAAGDKLAMHLLFARHRSSSFRKPLRRRTFPETPHRTHCKIARNLLLYVSIQRNTAQYTAICSRVGTLTFR
jgi:hypothetical protein